MSQTAPPSMTAPPSPAPDRDDPTNFAARGDATLSYITDDMVPDVTAAMTNVYNNAVDCYNNAVAADNSADAAVVSQNAAAASALASAASAGAIAWVSGTVYAVGDVRWSPAVRYTYRCIAITNSGDTTDPSTATDHWAPMTGPTLVIVSATTRSMNLFEHAVLENASASTATLPASPNAGDWCYVTVGNARADNVIARNGSKIMSLAEDLTVNWHYITVMLRYIDSTIGWSIV